VLGEYSIQMLSNASTFVVNYLMYRENEKHLVLVFRLISPYLGRGLAFIFRKNADASK